MPRVELVTNIDAPPEACFDLSRSIDLRVRSMHESRERAIGGVTSGLIGPDEEVLWEARHFGLRHRHRSRITACDRPRHFRDEMVSGRFRSFRHDHFFDGEGRGTRMRDVLNFESPGWLVGKLVNGLVLTKYLANLLAQRNALIKATAEGTTAPSDAG